MFKKFRAVSRYLAGFQIPLLAASASFYMILSLFPLLALVLSLLRYLPLTVQDLLSAVGGIFPAALMGHIEALLQELYSSNVLAVVSVTVLTAMWSASRGVFGILTGVNAILGSDEHRSYLRRRLTAIIYTVLLILALMVTLVLQVFGQSILTAAARWNLRLFGLLSGIFRLRFLFTAAFLSLLFMMLFAAFPAKHMRLSSVTPGAAATAVGWLGFSYLFSIYVEYGGSFRFYGSMTAAVLAMLWLYVCMSILFYGAVLCRLAEEGKLSARGLRGFLRP